MLPALVRQKGGFRIDSGNIRRRLLPHLPATRFHMSNRFYPALPAIAGGLPPPSTMVLS